MTDLHQDAMYEDDPGPPAAPARRIRYNPNEARGGDAYGAAMRHSRLVRRLKFILPGLALLGVAVFWGTARFIPGGLDALVQSAGIDMESNSVVMQKPHISGFEGTRRAYEVKADNAVQNLDDPKVVTFNAINGRFGLDEAGEANLDATTGIYDGNSNTLTLKDGIDVTTNAGYAATLQGAAIDLAKGTLVSNQPIEIRTGEGTIRANGVSVSERGKRVTFTNGVSVVYLPPAELVTETGRTGDAPAVGAE
ncbi:MAG: LPS export ABC transporter periplasmic protein LptC [Bauldia sp.]|nr:LPS export ABC transporter periplasmic protein LptC [Bauldia sp.]